MMKKCMIISLGIIFLSACENMERNAQREALHQREVMDTERITQNEKHQLEMEQDKSLGYPEEKGNPIIAY